MISTYGIVGSSGKMGREIDTLLASSGLSCTFRFDINESFNSAPPGVIIDFSLPSALNHTLDFCRRFNSPLIIGTTGLSPEQLNQLKELGSVVPVVQSYNYSMGIQLLLKCASLINKSLPDWDAEISETHHRFKLDKPSGTALMIKDALSKNVNISSLRLGDIPGDHTVYFAGLGESLSLTHRAVSRRAFAEGVLAAVKFMENRSPGFYSFSDVLFNDEV